MAHETPHRRPRGGPPLRWIWAWMLMVLAVVVATWHVRGAQGQRHDPILLVILVLSTAAVGFVTMRFTRRIHRLRRAVEQISLRDLTTRVSLEGHDAVSALAQSFNHMVDRMDAQERVRRQFFADLTHEIRHPIAILLGRLESIQDGVVPLSEEQVLYLHDMTLGLKRIVTDMSDLSLADVGQLSLHLAPVDVKELVAQIQGNLEPVAEDAGLSLTSEVEDALPPIMADGDRLRQVLTNLVTNAFHHTAPGGQVALTAKRDADAAVFEVVDNGSGIAPEDLPHLFERFYRADKARSRTKGGSGLGLAIVRSIVEVHGGSVDVASSLGQGSHFTVRIPIGGPLPDNGP